MFLNDTGWCYILAMNLKQYIFSLPPAERQAIAVRCDTSAKHLQNCAYGYKTLDAATCVALERESGKAVTRKDMRADWQLIWPELATDLQASPQEA